MISDAISSAQSSLTAYQDKLNVHAQNIANIDTVNYKSDEIVIEEDFVNASISKDDSEGYRLNEKLRNVNIETINQSNVDLPKEVVGSMVAQRGYEASLKVFQAADNLNKQVIDLFS